MMKHIVNCTGCGAELEYLGEPGHMLRCQYCDINVPVPETFWQEAELKQTMNKWVKYLIIFLVITFGVPTCLGLIGTILGLWIGLLGALLDIGGPFFGIFTVFLARIFAH
jgi:hypothetical protein